MPRAGCFARQPHTQLLTESLILALLGGALGAFLGWLGTRLLTHIAANLPRADEIHTDVPVLAFTLGVSLLAGVVFGLAPALELSRANLRGVIEAALEVYTTAITLDAAERVFLI